MRNHRVRVIGGTARFNKANRAAIATPDGNVTFIEFHHAVIATGSRPTVLAALPFDGGRVLDSTDALSLRCLPPSVAVVGADYIGIELATAFAKLGCKVTVVAESGRVLPSMEPVIGRTLSRSLKRLGVEVVHEVLVEPLGGLLALHRAGRRADHVVLDVIGVDRD